MGKLIYFPSFSVGTFASAIKKGVEINGLTGKFWSKDFPNSFRHPMFLLSAGHEYKKTDSRQDFDLDEDVLVFGDSGGYQIATGVLKWDEPVREKNRALIFNWLENNSNIAMNIDIPTRGNYVNKFDECLELSLENFDYFEKHQTGKTNFLNVIQGANFSEQKYWYSKVKHFNFQGWGIGGVSKNLTSIVSSLAILVENKEHLKESCNYIHYLGASRLVDISMLAYLQKILNNLGSKANICFDSSTPCIAGKYGEWYNEFDLKQMKFRIIKIKKEEEPKHNSSDIMPFSNIFDDLLSKHINLNQMKKYGPDSYLAITLHNLEVYRQSIKTIESYIQSDFIFIERAFKKEVVECYKIFDKIFNSKKPTEEFLKYETILSKFADKLNNEEEIGLELAEEKINKFFKTK